MAIIEGIGIENYRVLQSITLGKLLWLTPDASPLTPMTAVIGKNGVGKSSLFDAFGFLTDCLSMGVVEACDQRGRGGFDRIRSQGSSGAISFMVSYREEPGAPLITYILSIERDESSRPYVLHEHLFQERLGQDRVSHSVFMSLEGGVGTAWKGNTQGRQVTESKGVGNDLQGLANRVTTESAGQESVELEGIRLQDNHRLGIATLGALAQHPRIAAFREFLEGWYLSYFTPDAARSLPLAGPQRRLSVHGDNLGNVVQYMQREDPDKFEGILGKIDNC